MNTAIKAMRDELTIILHGKTKEQQEPEWRKGRAILRGLIGRKK